MTQENETSSGNIVFQSPTIKSIAAALVKAQAAMKPAKKDSENPFFKKNYADLSSVWDAIRDPFVKNGLAVTQQPIPGNGNVMLITTLMHESGEWIRSAIEMKPVKADPQGYGSCLTYARRYALSAIAGVCSEEDDDGNAASNPGKRGEAKRETKKGGGSTTYKKGEPDTFFRFVSSKTGKPTIGINQGERFNETFLTNLGANEWPKGGKVWFIGEKPEHLAMLEETQGAEL